MDSLSAAIESSFGGRPEAAARPAPSTLHCVAHPAAYLPGAFHLPGIGVPLARNGRSTCSGISVPLAPESVFHLVRCTHLAVACALARYGWQPAQLAPERGPPQSAWC